MTVYQDNTKYMILWNKIQEGKYKFEVVVLTRGDGMR